MIRYMVIEIFPNEDDPIDIVAYDIDNIQTAEAERELWLMDNDFCDPLNVLVIQYKE